MGVQSAEVPFLSDLSTSANWQGCMCLLCQRQNSSPTDLCATVRENEGCVECAAKLESINVGLGETTELNPSSKGRLEDVQVFEIYMLSESNVWYVHGFIGMLPKKVVILSRENISYLLKISELFLNQCFPLLPSTWITWNTENRINSRHLTSLSRPCLLHVHLFTNPKYFPSPLRENDSRDNFAGFFVLFCCPFQYVHTIKCSLTWSLWDSWTQCMINGKLSVNTSKTGVNSNQGKKKLKTCK